MAARIHRRLRLVVSLAELLIQPLFGGADLADEVRRSIAAIDPCNDAEFAMDLLGLAIASVAIGEVDEAKSARPPIGPSTSATS